MRWGWAARRCSRSPASSRVCPAPRSWCRFGLAWPWPCSPSAGSGWRCGNVPWRWLGLAPLLTALALALLSRPPDMLVQSALDLAAVRTADGEVMLLERRRDRLVRDAWLRSLGVADAVAAPKPGAGPEHGVACDEAGCVVDLAGTKITLAFRVEAAVEDCRLVALVIARSPSWREATNR